MTQKEIDRIDRKIMDLLQQDARVTNQALADKVPGSRLELVDGGHMLPVTQPERTARFVEEAAATRQALRA